MADQDVRYLVFDCECVADGELVSKVRFPGEGLSAEQAIARYRAELLEDQGNDFIPYTFQIPVSLVVAKVADDFRLIDLVALDEPEFRPHIIVQKFWKGWEAYRQPTLVTFNGRSFDIPLLELAAYRYGISLPKWFSNATKTWDQPRNRYNTQAHFDLQEALTNMGASRFSGGLNLAASLIGKPGKMEITGYMVQDMHDAGRLQEIADYCRCDVLDTYFVFLRTLVLQGRIDVARERELNDEAVEWLEQGAAEQPIFRQYLDQCQDWADPWEANSNVASRS